jgi:SAM-dependent methyltransferase
VPPAILAQAPEPPWGFLPGMFDVLDEASVDTPSRRMALAALGAGGSVLDVGCGGGIASLALVPPATELVGVDERPAALSGFVAAASAAGAPASAVDGRWPEVADKVEPADVVVCHHVLYNAPDLPPFVEALTAKARRLVVVELTAVHPLVYLAPLWRRFWDVERPPGPRADDALDVLRELGYEPEVELGHRPPGHWRSPEQQVHLARKRLCLPAERDPEVADALAELPAASDDIWAFAWPGSAP